MPQPKRRLKIEDILTVGFVPAGDDPEALIPFYKARDDVDKRAATFGEIANRDDARREVWDVTERMSSALSSALFEADADQDRAALISASLEEFAATVRGRTAAWVAAIPVQKQDTPGGLMDKIQKMLKALGLRAGISEAEVDKLLDDDGADDGSGSLSGTDHDGGDMPFDITKLDDEARAAYEAMEARAVAAEAEVTKTDDADDADAAAAELLKELPESVRKRFEDLEKRTTDAEAKTTALETDIAKRDDDAERDKFIKKAGELEGLPGVNPDDFADVLRKAYDGLDAEHATKLDNVLKAAAAQLAASKLLEEFGNGGHGASPGVEAEVEELAKAKITADPSLSPQLARGQVWKDRPDLLHKHEAARLASLGLTTED